MSKLLDKPLKMFALYALLLLSCSIPVYYLVVDHIWLGELDEHNHIIQQRIENKLSKSDFSDEEIGNVVKLWSVVEPGTSLEQVFMSSIPHDSLYEVTRTTDFDGEIETDRFRGLQSYIQINGKTYRLTTETNVEEADETLSAIAVVTVAFFALLLLGFILLNRRISKQIWQPFYATLRNLRDFDLNKNPALKLDSSDIEEFAELNQELEKLILRSVSTFNQQKEFIENASHELQTPLAILRTKLELLLQNESLTQEQSELVSSINAPLSRISRINKNLLLLAKIENQQFADSEQVEIVNLTEESLELVSDYIANKHISVERLMLGNPIIQCNHALFEILVNNLLINAITHNGDNGIMLVEVSEKGIAISNSGSAELNAQKLFQRFSMSSSSAQSSGLGLAIAKEICERYNWTISYRFENGLHVFSFDF
ncbi:MAG: HAMP domain-containing histidine kinase [Flavobacteriales bacterium]|nr:HAMP domain-containing histidine kinase [Flavobacteriales bacterium]